MWQAFTPSNRALCLLGQELVKYLVRDHILHVNGFGLPDTCLLPKKHRKVSASLGDLDATVKAGSHLGSAPCRLIEHGNRCDARLESHRPAHMRMEVVCCSASLGWACVMAGLHSHLLVHDDLKDKLTVWYSGDTGASDADKWLEWLHRDSPRALADAFCACLAAVLLDASWNVAYQFMLDLVELYVLGPQLAGVELLKARPIAQAEPIPWAWLDETEAQHLWEDAVDRRVVANINHVAAHREANLDDLYIARSVGAGTANKPTTGSCPQTAELRALLCHKFTATLSPAPVTHLPAPTDLPPSPQNSPGYCALCHLICNSPEQWVEHRNGQKHRKRAAQHRRSDELAPAPAPAPAEEPHAPGTEGSVVEPRAPGTAEGHAEEPRTPGTGGSADMTTSTLSASAPEFVPVANANMATVSLDANAAQFVPSPAVPGHYMGQPGYWLACLVVPQAHT